MEPLTSQLKNNPRNLTLGAIVIGLLVGLAPFTVNWLQGHSVMTSYKKTTLDMPWDEAIRTLEASGIECSHWTPTEAATVCRFSDRWRTYAIYMDRDKARVAVKRFAFKRESIFDLLPPRS